MAAIGKYSTTQAYFYTILHTYILVCVCVREHATEVVLSRTMTEYQLLAMNLIDKFTYSTLEKNINS